MNFSIKTALLFLCLFSALSRGEVMKQKADLILTDGLVPDLRQKKVRQLSVAICKDQIIFVGSKQAALKFKTPDTKVVSIRGMTLLPGFHDAHLHFEEGAKSITSQLSVRYLNLDQIRQKIIRAIELSPPDALIEAYHFHQTYFENERWPDRNDLDDISPNNPVIIHRVDGHSAWVNSRALQLAGIDKNTPDPPGGKIEHLPDGSPSGILKEKATDLLANIRAPQMVNPDAPRLEDPILYAQQYANSLGITAITTSASYSLLNKLQNLNHNNRLTLRFHLWLNYPELIVMNSNLSQINTPYLKFDLIKFFADGTLGSRTAYLFNPYRGDPDNFGLLIQPLWTLREQINGVLEKGWSVLVHSIGDRSTSEVLNIFQQLRKKGLNRQLLRIEHVQFLQDEDLKKFAEYKIVASMQPTHCTTDLLVAEDYLEPQTHQKGYRWKSLLKNNALLAFGTDWPVEPLDPRRGLYSAITRKNIEQQIPAGGWLAEEKLDIFEAIRAYTQSPYLAVNRSDCGEIAAGKLADLVVFNIDLVKLAEESPEGLLTAPVYLTICGGRIVYQRNSKSE